MKFKGHRDIHRLKTWPEPFTLMQAGHKDFEIRKNDRGFKDGDVLVLDEWNPQSKRYTMAEPLVRVVTCIVEGFGLHDGYVCMGVRRFADEGTANLILQFAPERATELPSDTKGSP